MAHQPQMPQRYVCTNCQVMHAGTPIHLNAGEHTWEAPATCGACGESEFVETQNWERHHD